MFFLFKIKNIIEVNIHKLGIEFHRNSHKKKSPNLLLLEKTKLDREIKYRTDYDNYTESLKGRGVTIAGAKPHYDALLREKDRDIELIDFKIRQLDLEE